MQLIVKQIAKSKRISGVDLAKMAGMTQQNMSNIMNNKINPSLDTLEKIAKALGVHTYELFEDYQKNISINCPNCGEEIHISINEKR